MWNRRDFLTHTVATGAVGTSSLVALSGDLALGAEPKDAKAVPAAKASPGKSRFQLRYAPHFGMFKHHAGDDLVDQLKFMADEGFTALEDNGMRKRSTAEQEGIRKAMDQLGMTMGVFVAHGDFGQPTFASGKKDHAERVLADIRASLEVAKRVNAKWCTVVPGRVDHKLPHDYQTAHAIDLLKRCAEICEPAGLTMVLEPLNHWTDHPELFLHRIPQGYLICRAVGSPSCKILFDIYHQQITEGNLIPNMKQAWDEVAYYQIGDNPGRKEPGTGEINYRNIFKFLHERNFAGILGMEHGNFRPGKQGERDLINAYIAHDKF